jgi:hypothetical protein
MRAEIEKKNIEQKSRILFSKKLHGKYRFLFSTSKSSNNQASSEPFITTLGRASFGLYKDGHVFGRVF